jgi:vesicle transport through interaction with t-SNAREs protein 1
MQQLTNANGNIDTVISANVEIEGELSEAEGYLRAMEVEFRTMASADKRTVQQKVGDYKEEYKQLFENFQSAKRSAESSALKSNGNTPAARNKLLTANQKLDNSTATLEQSRILLANTENIGNTIIDNMEAQKETLQGAQTKVQETKGFTDQAKDVLRQMGNRAIVHKMCVMFTILVLLAAICGLIYYKFIGDGKK